MQVTIRTYEPRDAAGLADVFFRSVRQVALADYTAAQVAAWAPERPAPERLHKMATDGRLTLVAVNAQDRAVAFIDLEPDGHIDHLFCAPEAAGHGIASQLYGAVEAAARHQGINRLFTEASELARRVFEKKGFALIERQDKALRGVPIHNYKMAKELPVTLSRTLRCVSLSRRHWWFHGPFVLSMKSHAGPRLRTSSGHFGVFRARKCPPDLEDDRHVTLMTLMPEWYSRS